jgi:hypothetical protein
VFEYFSFTAGMLLLLAIQFFVIGGALAGGVWTVWRVLERFAARPAPEAARARMLVLWVVSVLVLMAAAWFAFGLPAMPLGTQRFPDGSLIVREGSRIPIWLQFILFLVFATVVAGVVGAFCWILRTFGRGPNPPPARSAE